MSEAVSILTTKKKVDLHDIQKALAKEGSFVNQNNTETTAEFALGDALLKEGILVYPQHVLEGTDYAFDFLVKNKKVFIEVDGGVHREYERMQKDFIKDRTALSKGYAVLRYSNKEVMQDATRTAKEIRRITDGYPIDKPSLFNQLIAVIRSYRRRKKYDAKVQVYH